MMVSIDGYPVFFQVRRRGDNEVGIDIGVRKKSDWHGLGPGDAREKENLPLGDPIREWRPAKYFRYGGVDDKCEKDATKSHKVLGDALTLRSPMD